MSLSERLFPTSVVKRHQITTVDLTTFDALKNQVRLFLKASKRSESLLQAASELSLSELTAKLSVHTPKTVIGLVLAELNNAKTKLVVDESQIEIARIFGAETSFNDHLFRVRHTPASAYQEMINRFYLIPQAVRILPKKISAETASFDIDFIPPYFETALEQAFVEGFFTTFAADFVFSRQKTKNGFTDTLHL